MSLAGFYIAEPMHPLILRKLKLAVGGGGSVPADKVLYAESQFIRDCDSEWSKMKFVGSFMSDQSLYSRYALNIDVIGSALAITGSPTLTSFSGWKGNPGTTNYLTGSSYDNFGLSTNNLSLGVFISDIGSSINGAGSNFNIIGGLHSSDTGTILQYTTAGMRGGTSVALGSVITATSNWMANNDFINCWRVDNTNFYISKNGSVIATGTAAPGSQSTQTTWKVLSIQRSGAATGSPSDFVVGGVCLSLGNIDSAKMTTAFQNLKTRVN